MAKLLTWREFNSQRMSKYMKKFGGHGGAIRQIAKEWRAYKIKFILNKMNKRKVSSLDDKYLDRIIKLIK